MPLDRVETNGDVFHRAAFGAARSAFRASSIRRAGFPAIKKNFAPALAARFASTDSAKDGKIHQVIGAVVDGMWKIFSAPTSGAPHNGHIASQWQLRAMD